MSYMCRRRRRRVHMKDLYLYRRRRLYGVDTDVPGDRQGHKTHTCSMLPVSPKIKISALSSIHYWGDTPNRCVFMIFHRLPSLLPSRRIFVFASLPQHCLRAKRKTNGEGACTPQSALWLCIAGIYIPSLVLFVNLSTFSAVRGIRVIRKMGPKIDKGGQGSWTSKRHQHTNNAQAVSHSYMRLSAEKNNSPPWSFQSCRIMSAPKDTSSEILRGGETLSRSGRFGDKRGARLVASPSPKHYLR